MAGSPHSTLTREWYNHPTAIALVHEQMIFNAEDNQLVMTHLERAGAQVSPDLITHIDAHAAVYAPLLRTRLAQRLPLNSHEDALYTRSHALIFLSHWHDLAALDIIAEVFVRHDDLLDGLYEVFEATIPAFGPTAIPVLADIIRNDQATPAARIVCVTTLGYIAHLHPLSARSIIKTLRDALPVGADIARDDFEVWSWVVTTLAELRSKAAAAQVDELYKAGVLDPNICGRPEEYRRALRESPMKATFAQPLTLYS